MMKKMMTKFLLLSAAVACGFGGTFRAQADDWKNPADQWKTVGPPKGTLLIVGGTADDSAVRRFLELTGKDAPIVVIPTAGDGIKLTEQNYAFVKLRDFGAKDLVLLHTKDHAEADTEAFVAPLKRAKGVWISGGGQSRLAASYLHTRTHQALFDLLARGGVIAGNSAGASIQGSYLYGGGDYREGFGFVRDTAIGQHYIRRSRVGSMYKKILVNHPELLGVSIDEVTTFEVQGNRGTVLGDSKVVVCDPKAGETEDPPHLLYPGESYDLAARKAPPLRVKPEDSALGEWQAPDAETLAKGRLLLSGGAPADEHGSPMGVAPGAGVLDRFLALAGGPDAPLVVIYTKGELEQKLSEDAAAELKRLGAKNVILLHTIDRNEANLKTFAAPLEKARGVWIADVSEWKLADAYRKTLVHRELAGVLARGGVVAGNGGGAGILGSSLCDGGFNWNFGLGLLPKSVIWNEPLEKSYTAKLDKLRQERPGIQTIGLKPESLFLVENGKLTPLPAAAGQSTEAAAGQ